MGDMYALDSIELFDVFDVSELDFTTESVDDGCEAFLICNGNRLFSDG